MPDADPVEHLREQWQAELPDLDSGAMATVARLNRARALVMRQVGEAMNATGSSLADFDVLATLRRQGPPYELKPSTIARSVMLSPSAMTHRIDQLERAGLVQRVEDPTSRRTAPVALTAPGLSEAERLARELVETEEEMLSNLTAKERATLDQILTKLAASLARPA